MPEVTDPAILAQLNGTAAAADPQAQAPKPGIVTDPDLLRQLNAQTGVPDPNRLTEQQAGPRIAEKHTPKEAAINIGAGVAGGGLFAAALPELITGAGIAMEAHPATAPAGLWVASAGRIMRAERGAAALAGALTGGLSTGAGEMLRATGTASESAIALTELGAGILAPGPGVISHFVPRGAKAAFNVALNLSQGIAAGTNRAKVSSANLLKGEFAGGLPERDLYEVVNVGTKAYVQGANEAAAAVRAWGKSEAAKFPPTFTELSNPGLTKAQQILQKAEADAVALEKEGADMMAKVQKQYGSRIALAQNVAKQAEPKLLATVGKPDFYSDIGNRLEAKITQQKQLADSVREQSDKVLRSARDAEVRAQEASGKFIDQMPAYVALKKEIAQKLNLTQEGRAANRIVTPGGKVQGLAPVTESGVEGAYRKIWDTINNKKVMTNAAEVAQNPNVVPKYETFKTTFDAIDHVRRKLGDAGYGKEAEGYGALGQKLAKDMYQKLSEVQKQYAPNTQEAVQSAYTKGLEASEKFKTRMARRSMDPESESSNTAKAYFKTKDSVQDLHELVGDPAVVNEEARKFAARSLAGRSTKEVETWVKANEDWMRAVPGLKESVSKYSQGLTQIEAQAQARLPKGLAQLERIEQKATASAKQLQSERLQIRDTTATQAAGLRQTGRESAVKSLEQSAASAQKTAEGIIGSGFDAGKIQSALTSGPVDSMKKVFQMVGSAPGGKKAIEGSVRMALAGTSPKRLREVWDGRLKVALEEGNVLPPKTLEKLDRDVTKAFEKMTPKEASTFAQRLFQRTLLTPAVMGEARAVGLLVPKPGGGQQQNGE